MDRHTALAVAHSILDDGYIPLVNGLNLELALTMLKHHDMLFDLINDYP